MGGGVALVCGSRGWTDEASIRGWLESRWPSLVVHGAHWEGADAITSRLCGELLICQAKVPAYWKQQGRSAGPIRNAAMSRLAPALSVVVGFWDGASTGTKGMLDLARTAGVPVEVVRP